jgi:hypothetical protein
MIILTDFTDPKVKVTYRKLKNTQAGRVDFLFNDKKWQSQNCIVKTPGIVEFYMFIDGPEADSLSYMAKKDMICTIKAETQEEFKILSLPIYKSKNTFIFLPEEIEAYYPMTYIKNW